MDETVYGMNTKGRLTHLNANTAKRAPEGKPSARIPISTLSVLPPALTGSALFNIWSLCICQKSRGLKL